MSASTSYVQLSQPAAEKGLLSRHPILAFFALAYAISWLILLPLLLGNDGLGLFSYRLPSALVTPLILLALFGPTLSGLVMTAKLEGWEGVRALLSSYLQWRVGWRWYVAALLLSPSAILAAAFLIRGEETWQVLVQGNWVLIPEYFLFLVVIFFIGGPLGEETGWRGFALPRLQARYGALVASLLLGIGWVVWHLPNFFIPATNTWTGSFWLYLGIGLSLSVLHTWVYNGARGSLLMVTLLHAAVDASTRLFLPAIFGSDRDGGNWVPLIAFGVWALIVIGLTWGKLALPRPGTTSMMESTK